jgi:hypothetical protein
MNKSQKETMERTAPQSYTYMENKLSSQYHEGLKIWRQLEDILLKWLLHTVNSV